MEHILPLIVEYDMLPPGEVIVCALSGGRDSVCLLHYLHQQGYPLVAAHFNHQLRGAEAQRDEDFCVALCAQWHIPLTLGRGDVAAMPGNVEANARTLRYAFLQETAQATHAAAIATGHTADDNMETVLLALTRGCALGGLTGIPPRRGNIVRPLLHTDRTALATYVATHRLTHIEDSTNDDDTYARNKLRHQVLPVLATLNPQVVAALSRCSDALRRDESYLTARAMAVAATGRQLENAIAIPAITLAQLPAALFPRVVRLLLDRLDVPPLTAALYEDVLALCRGDDPSGCISLPHGVVAHRVYDQLLFSLSTHTDSLAVTPLEIGQTISLGGGWRVTLVSAPCPEKNQENRLVFWLDCAKLSGGLFARTRQVGDSLRLPGRHTKTIQKLLLDEKIPRLLRDTIPVLADAVQVVAVAGFGPHSPLLATPGQPAVGVILEKDVDCHAE